MILLKESYSFDDLVDNDTDNDTFWLTGVNDFFMTLKQFFDINSTKTFNNFFNNN